MEQQYHSTCFVCNSPQITSIKGYEKHDLAKCKNCGFVFMRRIPSLEDLDMHYSTYSYGREQYLSPITIKSYNALLDEFEKFRSTGKILDVGCGVGFFLEQAKKRGWEVYGTEFSSTAVQVCTEKGINMKQGVLNLIDFEGIEFDVITSFEVIEHINNPKEELKNMHNLLRKGGLFYCTTPNFNSLLRYYLKSEYNIIGYPEHLSYYTKRTLSRVIRQQGFKRIKFQSTGISITRFKTSTGKSKESLISKTSSDEVLRQKIDKRWYLAVAKSIINSLLTFSRVQKKLFSLMYKLF